MTGFTLDVGFYLNGKWVDATEASIPAMDRGFLFGEGVFETVRTWNGEPFALSLHLERLKRSAAALGMEMDLDATTLHEILEAFLEKTGRSEERTEYRFRIILTTGDGKHDSLYIYAEPLSIPTWIYDEGVRVGLSRYRRTPIESCPPSIKFLSRPDLILSRFSKNDYYEMIVLNVFGRIAEGTLSNVFFVLNGKLVTPDEESGVLRGVTRTVVINMAKRLEIPIEERPVELWEAFEAEEMFLTHTSGGIVPVKRFLDKVYIDTTVDGLTKLLMDNLGEEISSNDVYWM